MELKTTKEEKIKEAYGKYYHIYIDGNGWCEPHHLNKGHYNKELFEFGSLNDDFLSPTLIIRPISLQGIEDNNGWIKIESDNDLPSDENIMYRIGMFLNCGRFHQDKNLCNLKTALEALKWNYSHYQEITESAPPIY